MRYFYSPSLPGRSPLRAGYGLGQRENRVKAANKRAPARGFSVAKTHDYSFDQLVVEAEGRAFTATPLSAAIVGLRPG